MSVFFFFFFGTHRWTEIIGELCGPIYIDM